MEMTGGQVAELSGAEIVSRCLAEEKVEFLFGYILKIELYDM